MLATLQIPDMDGVFFFYADDHRSSLPFRHRQRETRASVTGEESACLLATLQIPDTNGAVIGSAENHRSSLPLRHRQRVGQEFVAGEGSTCLLATLQIPYTDGVETPPETIIVRPCRSATASAVTKRAV